MCDQMLIVLCSFTRIFTDELSPSAESLGIKKRMDVFTTNAHNIEFNYN